MRKIRAMLAILLCCAALEGCGRANESSAPLPTPDNADIARVAHGAYVAAINSNDVETLMKAVTEDVVYMPPHEMSVAGKAAVRSWVRAYFEAFNTRWEKTALEFVVAGDWAFEQYSYTSTDTPKAGGAAVVDTGKGINIYHRDADGIWRVARDAWNSDLPVPKK